MIGDKPGDIDAEFKAACSAVTRAHLQWMLNQGVAVSAMYRDFFRTGFTRTFCVAAIEILRDNSWVFTVGTRKAIIVHTGDDLVAFFPNAPDLMYRRLNYQTIAGEVDGPFWRSGVEDWNKRQLTLKDKPADWTEADWLAVHNVMDADDPRIWVHENVLEWMRAGFDGIVILDWTACLPLVMRNSAGWRVRREAFATKLYNALTRPFPAPRIFVTE